MQEMTCLAIGFRGQAERKLTVCATRRSL